MWNQIRTPPFIAAGPGGKPSLVAAGFQSQYGVETQIVMALYGVLAFSIYALAVHIPTIKDPARQRLALYTWLGIHLTGFGVLLALFRLKNDECQNLSASLTFSRRVSFPLHLLSRKHVHVAKFRAPPRALP